MILMKTNKKLSLNRSEANGKCFIENKGWNFT